MAKNRKINKASTLLICCCCILFLLSVIVFSYFGESRPKNILIITIDTVRADHVGVYGYFPDVTPNIDAFARQSVVFWNAIAQASWTPPSLASILSSNYPNDHGVADWDSLYNPKIRFLGEKAAQYGFQTAFFTNHPSLALDNIGFTRGFAKKVILQNNSNRADEVAELTNRWLGKERKWRQPFIAWVHFFDPHEPFTPSEPFATKFLNKLDEKKAENVPVCSEESYYGFDCIAPYIVQQGITNLQYYSLMYDAEIAEADAAVGKIINYAKKIGLWNNTVIIVASDHGEIIKRCGLWENKCVYFSHGTYLYQELLRVPMIVHVPNIKDMTIVKNNVATIDIVPTVLNLLGIPRDNLMRGVSLFPFDTGRRDRQIFSYEMRNKWMAVFYDRWKLIYYPDYVELFDLKSYLSDYDNIAGDKSLKLNDIEHMLTKVAKKNLYQKYDKTIVLDKYYREKLSALGYAQSSNKNITP